MRVKEMVKYHINDKGEIKKCTAKTTCRFTSVDIHFESVEAARATVEDNNKNIYGTMPTVLKRVDNKIQKPKADNSKCETLFMAFIEAKDGGLQARRIAEIEALPSNKKPTLLKNLHGDDLMLVKENLYREVSQVLNVKDVNLIKDSSNNRVGSDLIETTTGVSIEVKLGRSTDANLGFPTVVDGILEGVKGIDTGIQKSFFTAAQRQNWKELYRNDTESFTTIQVEQGVILQNLVEDLNGSRFTKTLGKESNIIMNKLWSGITSASELNDTKPLRRIFRFELQADNSCKYIDRNNLSNDVWEYGEFVYSDKKRFSFKVYSEEQTFSIIMNYKNNYTIPGTDIKVPARFGLGTANFNGKFTSN